MIRFVFALPRKLALVWVCGVMLGLHVVITTACGLQTGLLRVAKWLA